MTGDGIHVRVEDVYRQYGRGSRAFMAVRGVSFDVRRGELFALLGTNGAGKTSTVELIEGLARPHRGRIQVFGDLDPVDDRARIRPRMGAMLQAGGVLSHLTVQEMVRAWCELASRARPVEEAVEMVGLSERADVQLRNLSGGELRRLDLALATVSSPELLFLDEPPTGMDAEGRHATWKLIQRLQEHGSRLILTTHHLEEAENLADRVAIMHRGRVAVAGTVAEIVADFPSTLSFHTSAATATLNLPVSGEVQQRNGRITVTTQRLQEDATRLLGWAADGGIELDRFTARPASLEEAFISIASRQEGAEG